MRRRAIITASALAILALTASSASAADLKVGVIDVEYVIQKSNKGKAAKKKLKKDFEKKQKVLDTEQNELLELRKQLENPPSMWTDAKKKEKLMDYQKRLMALQESFVKNQQELAKKEVELMKPILKKLEEVLTGFADKGGYDLIMNRSQHGVLFTKPALDITELVLKELNG